MDFGQQNPARLPEPALEAWQCYVEMIASKNAHFEFLEHLEIKYQNGGTRTLAENARLETLLSTHNERVSAFAAARKSLAASDADAHEQFVKHLASL